MRKQKEQWPQWQHALCSCGGLFDVQENEKKLQDLELKSQAPDFWNHQEQAKALLKEKARIENLILPFLKLEREFSDQSELLKMARDEGDSSLQTEVVASISSQEKELRKLELKQMLSGEMDSSSAILNINAGSGGTEACDWASILLRMYTRWAERRGFKLNLLDHLPGEGAGIKSTSIEIDGSYAYGYLRSEIGVHRLVRISPFDSNARRHTSFASVFVSPVIDDDIEIDIKDSDIKMDTFRAGGAGGQHVNKTESAVRLTHIPSGVVVACQMERSQHKNRSTAMKMLRAKLYAIEMEKRRGEKQAIEDSKSDISWGSQIRSYVMQPYQLIKDHRTGFEMGNVAVVLDGDLDGFMEAYLISQSTGKKPVAGASDLPE